LTVTNTGNGVITSTPTGIYCGADCVETYTLNTNIQLTATAEEGYRFDQWSGDCSGTGTTTIVTMGAAKTCTATFVVKNSDPVVDAFKLTLTPTVILTDSQTGTTPLKITITGCNDTLYWKAETTPGGYITNLLVTPAEGNGDANVTLSYRKPSVMSPRRGSAKITVTASCGTDTTVVKKVNIR
jgi:hypothetical protein